MPTQAELLSLWQRASRAKLGLSVPTDDRVLLRQQLYRVRNELGEEFKDIIIVFPKADPGVLFMTRRNAETIAKEMSDG